MLWTGQWMSQWVSEWEMYVCHTNQIGSTINSQSNFLVVKVNGIEKIWSRYSSPIKEEEIFIYWVYFNIFCGLGLVIYEMNFEVWNSAWASCMQMRRDVLLLVTKVTWYRVNSIRGHASSLLVLRKCFRGDENILIWNSSNVYNSKCR